MTKTFHVEQLAGPADWFIEKDKEFDALVDKLSMAVPRVVDLVEKTHLNQKRLDGSLIYEHLKSVSQGAAKIAEIFYENTESVNERQYNVLICRFTALLHEVMPYSGCSYETIAAITDKTVADCVSSLTPYLCEPFTVRIEMLVNRVGRCGAMAQIVKLADLIDDALMYDRLIDHGGGVYNMFDAVQRYIVELESFLRNFHHIDKNKQVKPIIVDFNRLLDKLYRYVDGVDKNTPKKHSRRKQVV